MSRNDPGEIIEVGKEMPAWLASLAENDDSLQNTAEYRILPRIKVVQGTTKDEIKSQFPPGAIVITPSMSPLAEVSGSFLAVPLFCYTEYCKWSDLEDAQSPTILESSFDRNSALAKKCLTPELREETYGNGFTAKNSTSVNFVLYITDGPQQGETAILTFVRGTFRFAKVMSSMLAMRKIGGVRAPMWVNIFQFRSVFQDRGPKKKYWAAVPENPPEGFPAFVSHPDTAAKMKAAYLELKRDYEESRLAGAHVDQNLDIETEVDEDLPY